MTPEQKQAIERFCAHIKTRDPWLWGDTARNILTEVDYDASAQLVENDGEYIIACYLRDGRMVELEMRHTGWGCKWESPEEKRAREIQWPDDGLSHFARKKITADAPKGDEWDAPGYSDFFDNGLSAMG